MMPGISALFLLLAADPLVEGIRAFHEGRYAEARQLLEQAPEGAERGAFLAVTRAAMGECKDVTVEIGKQFAGATNKDLRRITGTTLVQCHLAGNAIGEAEPVVRELLKQFPDDADVLYQSARLHMKAWNDAVYQMYQKTPASYRVNQLSGEILETQGKLAEAAAEYRKAIEKNPKALNVHFRLGRALLLQAQTPATLAGARAEFEKELALNPSDAAAEFQVGQIFVAEGNREAGRPRLERALKLAPEFGEATLALAKLHAEEKQYGQAIALLEPLTRRQPNNEAAHYNLMLAYRNSGQTDKAKAEKQILDKLQKPPEGEFTDFLKKLGEKK